jgi:hypothetical protein
VTWICAAATPTRRAAGFDPLTLRAHEDVRAISSHAWFSLGRHGVGLHFQRAGRVSEVLVVRRAGRGKCWEVVMDGRPMERFSRLEAAVEAVDFELERMGRGAVLSAAPEAGWRRAAPLPVDEEGVGPRAANLGEALRLTVWRRYHPRREAS